MSDKKIKIIGAGLAGCEAAWQAAKLGVNGIGYSNIIVNVLILVVSMVLLEKENIKVFSKQRLNFAWTKEFAKVGSISGVESLVRWLVHAFRSWEPSDRRSQY